MSISAPRYAAGPVQLRGRLHRTLAILFRELQERAGAGTWFVMALTYATVVLTVVLGALFAPPGGASLSTFYSPFSSPAWPFLVLIVTTAVGSGAIADDLGNRSITLYLSRPIHLTDYLAAKASAVGVFIALAAIGPGVAGIVVLAGLGSISATLALSAIGAFIAVGLVTVVFFTGLAVALSSLSTKPLYAGVGIFGATFAAEISAETIGGVTGGTSIRYLGPFQDVQAAATGAFQTGASGTIDPLGASFLLLGAGILLLLGAWIRLARVEVVGE
jgi:hypothetical protein